MLVFNPKLIFFKVKILCHEALQFAFRDKARGKPNSTLSMQSRSDANIPAIQFCSSLFAWLLHTSESKSQNTPLLFVNINATLLVVKSNLLLSKFKVDISKVFYLLIRLVNFQRSTLTEVLMD